MRIFTLIIIVFILNSCGSSKRYNKPRFIEVTNLNYVEIKNENGKVEIYEIVYPGENDYGLRLKPKKGKRIYKGVEKKDYQAVKSIVENAIKSKEALIRFDRLKYYIVIFDNGFYRYYSTDILNQQELQEIYQIVKFNVESQS